eukprot:TRINITY_DN4755_c3_g3_i2.p1 TRINITY_DN4755_c3_g3~~TRINITY_DN4755_c3_g3_i2.p1  ORF type:complete len:472 (+),score=113.62 TRINITY_DN4755_c3_g3_i2:74-1489(+)
MGQRGRADGPQPPPPPPPAPLRYLPPGRLSPTRPPQGAQPQSAARSPQRPAARTYKCVSPPSRSSLPAPPLPLPPPLPQQQQQQQQQPRPEQGAEQDPPSAAAPEAAPPPPAEPEDNPAPAPVPTPAPAAHAAVGARAALVAPPRSAPRRPSIRSPLRQPPSSAKVFAAGSWRMQSPPRSTPLQSTSSLGAGRSICRTPPAGPCCSVASSAAAQPGQPLGYHAALAWQAAQQRAAAAAGPSACTAPPRPRSVSRRSCLTPRYSDADSGLAIRHSAVTAALRAEGLDSLPPSSAGGCLQPVVPLLPLPRAPAPHPAEFPGVRPVLPPPPPVPPPLPAPLPPPAPPLAAGAGAGAAAPVASSPALQQQRMLDGAGRQAGATGLNAAAQAQLERLRRLLCPHPAHSHGCCDDASSLPAAPSQDSQRSAGGSGESAAAPAATPAPAAAAPTPADSDLDPQVELLAQMIYAAAQSG